MMIEMTGKRTVSLITVMLYWTMIFKYRVNK
jgi:hypothetical protein